KVSSGEWKHATLSVNAGEHTIPSGSAISPSLDGKGVFIFRSADGTGENNFDGISLRWNYPTDLVANDAQLTIKVFAIEMVFIPQDSFYVGDGLSSKRFHAAGDTTASFLINSENAITLDDTATVLNPSRLWARDNMEKGNGTIPAQFPKGFKAFYLMKYEVTQGQYTEFLNMLTSAQATSRIDTSVMKGDRFTIIGGYPLFTTNRPTRACNYLAYVDGAAYADWAALRPITELELEKACRGTASVVAGEYAWGNTNIDITGNLSGVEDGTETVTGGLNVNHGVFFTNGDGGVGPIRSGIFAATLNTREGSGGSFYGVMEMSGNVWETVVSSGLASSRRFIGSNGDGLLSSNGNANNPDWSGLKSGEIVSNIGSGGRAGGWQNLQDRLRVSDRFYSNSVALREPGNGFRCARTAE
ncbi:MAG: SUMF1/EgtB/PvdO family nonheme iron enzyme, partial [Ignavibacteria bacterium]|nr:SUMF1/EgtB/PvdO family nonheme iron enzyme [Ignavibacteria bacterium]